MHTHTQVCTIRTYLRPVNFTCTARGSPEACMKAIKDGAAKGGDDFSVFGGGCVVREWVIVV